MFVEKDIGGKKVYFDVYDNICQWRVDTLRSKEPATIRWLEAMPKDAVLWDVGANIGIYTVYAAALGHRVIAIEPVLRRVASLEATLAKSGLADIVETVCGKANAIDAMTEGRPFPTHIKIDTDGDDLEVIKGAVNTLPKVQSVIIETSTSPKRELERAEIGDRLAKAGLVWRSRHVCPLVPHSTVGMDHWYRP